MHVWHLISNQINPAIEQKRDVDSVQKQSIGVSRGGRSTKIHAFVDGLGNCCVLMLTGGQAHDSFMMNSVLDQFDISKNVIFADKVYGSTENWNYIFVRSAEYCMLPKRVYQGLGNVAISAKKIGTWQSASL